MEKFPSYYTRAFQRQLLLPTQCLSVLIAPAASIAQIIALPQICKIWAIIFKFFINKLQLFGAISYQPMHFFWWHFWIPYPAVATATAPSFLIWSLTSLAVILLFYLSGLLSDAYQPAKYLLRALLFIQTIAQIYFFVTPSTFPYGLPGFAADGLTQAILIMFVVPWVLACIYYLLNYSLFDKILNTLLLLIFFTIAMPLQYMANVFLIANFSLLFMPIIYLFGGTLLDIIIFIAFYGFVISLTHKSIRHT